MITGQNAISAYLMNRAPASVGVADAGQEASFTRAGAEFEKIMQAADSSALSAMSGKTDTHELVQSLTEAELALDAAVAIRDKVVEAYQEILRMPV